MSDSSKIPRPAKSLSSLRATRIPSLKPPARIAPAIRTTVKPPQDPTAAVLARKTSTASMGGAAKPIPNPPTTTRPELSRQPSTAVIRTQVQTGVARATRPSPAIRPLAPTRTVSSSNAPPRITPAVLTKVSAPNKQPLEKAADRLALPAAQGTPFLPRMPAAWKAERLQDTSFDLDWEKDELKRVQKELADIRTAQAASNKQALWERNAREADAALEDAAMMRRMIKTIRDSIQAQANNAETM